MIDFFILNIPNPFIPNYYYVYYSVMIYYFNYEFAHHK
jgi:hypothetical protein